jgi:hypothetical protein
MTWKVLYRPAAWSLLLVVAGCGALDVSDPTTIQESGLDNATGAELLRGDAIRRLYLAVGTGALTSGLLTDEFFADPPGRADEVMLDQRQSLPYEGVLGASVHGGIYGDWQEVRRAATAAIPRLRTYVPEPAHSAHLAELFAVRGFATLHLAEQFCPGLPLNDVVDHKAVYGRPLSTDELLTHALADMDSALAYTTDSARILDLARVGRARALTGLGRFAEAGTTASLVSTGFVRNVEYTTTFGPLNNPLFFGAFGDLTRSVADREGVNGLGFVTAGDPRVQTTLLGQATDGVTGVYAMAKYPDPSAPIVLASWIEARLIGAESALNAGDPSWLTTLNDLRATQITPPLPALADPGSTSAQVDLLFNERAFWLFATGHRLGDLRRLIGHYGRASESVFPSGPYRPGGTYDRGTSIPFPSALEAPYNSAVTGCNTR